LGAPVGKAFLMKMVERMPTVCKAVIKVENLKSKIYYDLLNSLLVFPYVLFHRFDVFPIILQCKK
jgi:hypothetical protein